MGALLGLCDHRFDILALLTHAAELEKHFGVGPRTLSFPRLEPARLEEPVTALQQTLQRKEQAYRDVPRLARTQLQDAVPLTAGLTFGAWAEAVARDRWRIFKCRERIRQVNLGGTGLGAPRAYILRVTDGLRRITGL